MKFILRHTNKDGDHGYFVAHGQVWPHRHGFRLIGHTTPDRAGAMRFATHADAINALKLSDDPPGWEVDEVKE